MSSERKIWALLGDRQGNNNQTLGVAEALGIPFETKIIEFNSLALLPNFLLVRTTLGISSSSLRQLSPPWPDIVIAAGRKLARVALYIKSKNHDCFLAQIQHPGFPSHDFDLIASPQHDKIASGKNIIVTVGAPNRVSQQMLQHEADVWRSTLSNYPAPKIAMLIGGSSRNRHITAQQVRELAVLSSSMANALRGSLLITTSRRTKPENLEALIKNLTCKYYLHNWNTAGSSAANPFYGFLGLADAVIVTGDSVTMCSEACATGKPVYIYSSDDFTSEKHRRFHQALYERNLAKPLSEMNNSGLFTPQYRLNDAKTIASEIEKRILI